LGRERGERPGHPERARLDRWERCCVHHDQRLRLQRTRRSPKLCPCPFRGGFRAVSGRCRMLQPLPGRSPPAPCGGSVVDPQHGGRV
ncbi:unnamed protein product, partial [Pylaiella littoralis]